MDQNLLAHVLLPVAHDEDARLTARALEPYHPGRVTVLHVVEQVGGDTSGPPAKPDTVGEEAFAAVREVFPDAETRTTRAASVIDAIFETATDIEASAIAYRSRGGGRLLHFLSGDISLKLATQSPVPVLALPAADA
jgi:nucleotide-binding universal stress UspA family protein